MTTEQNKTQELYAQVVEKAWESSEFKKQLVANPVGAIEELSGGKLKIHDGKKLVVLDEVDTLNRQPKEDEIYLVIPESTYELTDEQLEAVAGGVTITISGSYSQKDGWDIHVEVDFSIF